MKCKDEYVYTFENGGATCDGWSNLSFEQCKQKCLNNDLPNGCNNKPVSGCSYATWYPETRWCHLANELCVIENEHGATLWKNPNIGKATYFYL